MITVKTPTPLLKTLGMCDYAQTHQAMLAHVSTQKPCAIWLLEHHPVYTKGTRSEQDHFLYPNDIPIIPTDRGGQVTYHGPGQMIVYPLLHLPTWSISPQGLVNLLEETTVQALQRFGIEGYGNHLARGVYIEDKKIASIGLKIKHDYSYHGIAININMDLGPFSDIVPCGDPNLTMTQLSNHTSQYDEFSDVWIKLFVEKLCLKRYNTNINH